MKSIPLDSPIASLPPHEIERRLNQLDHQRWQVVEQQKLRRVFDFSDFAEAKAFIEQVVKKAEEQNHHPDILWYYTTVVLEVWTHSVSGLTEKDFEFAYAIEHV